MHCIDVCFAFTHSARFLRRISKRYGPFCTMGERGTEQYRMVNIEICTNCRCGIDWETIICSCNLRGATHGQWTVSEVNLGLWIGLGGRGRECIAGGESRARQGWEVWQYLVWLFQGLERGRGTVESALIWQEWRSRGGQGYFTKVKNLHSKVSLVPAFWKWKKKS